LNILRCIAKKISQRWASPRKTSPRKVSPRIPQSGTGSHELYELPLMVLVKEIAGQARND